MPHAYGKDLRPEFVIFGEGGKRSAVGRQSDARGRGSAGFTRCYYYYYLHSQSRSGLVLADRAAADDGARKTRVLANCSQELWLSCSIG